MKNEYLIPANSKKSALILGLFTVTDTIILSFGIGISILSLLLISTGAELLTLMVAISPALIAATLVMPFPYYHNFMTFMFSVINFFSNRRKYIWKGWCYNDKYK